MWRKPYRPKCEISQTYNDGVMTVCSVIDVASPGFRPEEKLSQKVRLPYEEQRLGIQRYYSGQQNQVQIQRVVRCQNCRMISTQDIAITEDGARYQVNLIQTVPGVFPESVDITLSKIDQKYEKCEVIV